MSKIRKSHSPEFKVKVVLEVISGLHTMAELAKKYEIHPLQIGAWKKILLTEASTLFQRQAQKNTDTANKDKIIEDLYRKVGHSQMEVEWLKKKVGLIE